MARTVISGSLVCYHFDFQERGQHSWGFVSVPDVKVGGNVIYSLPYDLEFDAPEIDVCAYSAAALRFKRDQLRQAYLDAEALVEHEEQRGYK